MEISSNTLRVGIDASGLVSKKKPTGLERYLASLLVSLAPLCDAHDIFLHLYFSQPVSPDFCAQNTPLAQVLPGPRIRWRTAPLPRGWYRIGMGLAMQIDQLDVFHFPTPLMSSYCPVPAIVTFHDLAALSLQHQRTKRDDDYIARALDAGHRATAVIGVSQSTRLEIEQHVGRHDTRVILEGVNFDKFCPSPEANVKAMRARYGLDRYILCVGTLHARKNQLGLIRAFEKIQAQIPHTLVIVGKDGSGSAGVRAHLSASPNPRVKCLGYVDESVLLDLYTGADLLALPSLWEGFGLPLVEAMACGTPVLTSRISALEEVSNGAAFIVDPTSIEDIARGLHTVLTDSDLRERLKQTGMQRARDFSWAHTARHTIALYHDVHRQRLDR